MTDTPIPEEVKWRGSVYQLVNTEGDKVNWFNPVSRHYASCSMEAWMRADPYDNLHR